MKIAVLIGNMSFDSQKRMANGILDKALLDRATVHIFISEGGHYAQHSDYGDGERGGIDTLSGVVRIKFF